MFHKLLPAALCAAALSTDACSQSLPTTASAQGYFKIGDILGESFTPSLLVLGLAVLPTAPVPIPGGDQLRISPDLVTIYDPGARLPARLPADFRCYAQRLSLGGAPRSGDNDYVVLESLHTGSLRLPMPTLGGIVVGSPADD